MKKSLIVATIASLVGMGAAKAELSRAFTGFSVGASIGADSIKINPHLSQYTTGTTTNVAGSPYTNHIGKTVFGGEINAQYAMMFPHCFIGGVEVLFGSNNSKVNVWSTSTDTYRVKNTSYYGAFVNLGLFANEKAIIYVKLGGMSGNYKSSGYNSTLSSTYGATKKGISFTPGLGAKFAVNDRTALTAEIRTSLSSKLSPTTWNNTANSTTFVANSPKHTTTSFRAGVSFKVA